jgi:hypothetical protein
MQKPLVLSIAVCLGLTGCQVFEKSQTWETVTHVLPGDSIREPDPSSSYAEKLHRVLLEQGVEHLVVTYQYHYYTHQYDEAVGTRTAVVYRDNVSPSYPWWLKDDRLETPFWLPNGELDKQISFYARRKVEVIEKHAYPAREGNENPPVSLVHPAPPTHRVVAVEKPQPVTHIAPAKVVQAPAPKAVVTSHPIVAPTPAASTTRPAAVTKIQHPAAKVTAQAKPTEALPPSSAAAPHSNSFWSPPATIDPVAQGTDPAPRDEHLEKLFRQRNGTHYDPTSTVDRRKMEQLKHGLVGRETADERAFRQAVDGGETRFR